MRGLNEDSALEVEGLAEEVDGGSRGTEGVAVVWRKEAEGRELMGASFNPLDKREGGAFAATPSLSFFVTADFSHSLSSVRSTTLSAGWGRWVIVGAILPAVRDW